VDTPSAIFREIDVDRLADESRNAKALDSLEVGGKTGRIRRCVVFRIESRATNKDGVLKITF
jgi:hypothetical protein